MNNFKIFNQSLNNALTDSQYTNSQDRINGVLSELAKSTVHNKLFAQTSVAAYALAKFVSDHGKNALDRDADGFSSNIELVILDLINSVVSNRVPNTRASSKTYKKGDVVDSPYIPLWGELECFTAGKSANTDVLNGITINYIGQKINDGNCVWVIRPKRFQTLLNTPVPFRGNWTTPQLISEPSYPIHPEIGLPMIDYRLCDGTNGTIDLRNRFIMGADKANANTRSGTDTITINRNHLPTGVFGISITKAVAADWDGKLNFKKTFSTNEIDLSHFHNVNHTGTLVWAKQQENELGVNSFAGGSLQTSKALGKHKHSVDVEFKDISVKHNHKLNIAGNVVLNNASQQTISNVSQHYKMTYIQRIY